MMLPTLGVILLGGSVGTLWFMLPKNGKPNPLAEAPVLESAIPLGIVIGITVGAGLLLSSLIT
jgi:hypothetical protein